MRGLLWAGLLLGQAGADETRGVGGEGPPTYWPGPDEAGLHYGVSLEVSGLTLLPRLEGGAVEGYVQVAPTLILDGGERFGLNVGTPLRLHVAGGAPADTGLESVSDTLRVHAQVEARRPHGGFRQGFFGPDYELGRFVAAGPSSLPVAHAPFPDGYSAFGELTVARDTLHLDPARRELHLSLSAEAFSWGRLDAQVRISTWRKLRHRAARSAGPVGAGRDLRALRRCAAFT